MTLLETAKQLLKEAHYKQAIDAFQRVDELNKQAEIVEQIAVIQQRIGDYEATKKNYDHIILSFSSDLSSEEKLSLMTPRLL